MNSFGVLNSIWNQYYIVFIALVLRLLNYISFTQIILAYITYCIYVQITSRTYLYYTKTDKNEKLLQECPNLSNPSFKPHFLFPFAIQQMVLCSISFLVSNKPKLKFHEEKVNQYGTTLYWASFRDSDENLDENTPILFFMPGMTGDITDPYVINLCVEGLKNGYRVCVYQMRILNKNFSVDESKTFTYCDDVHSSLTLIRNKYKNAKILGISGSFGANNLLYYLGTKHSKLPKEKKLIDAAVSLSNPYDMELCSKLTEFTYIAILVTYLERKNSKKIRKSIENCPYLSDMNTEELVNCEDQRRFDEMFCARCTGRKSADDYYRSISPKTKICNVDIPVLCIHSEDDLITPGMAIPYDDIKLNENIILIVTDRGGHMAFISNEKFTELKQWHLGPAFEFLNAHKDKKYK